VLLCAASLALVAGSTIAIADQGIEHIKVQKNTRPSTDPERTQPEDPSNAPEKRVNARQDRLDQFLSEQQLAQRKALANGENLETIAADADALAGILTEDDTVSLNFKGDGIDIEAFVEYVRRVLNTNIMITGDGLAGRRVRFEASHEVPTNQLLNLLAGLVEQQGFALVTNEMGWYEIIQQNLISPSTLGELATTKVISTPLLKPSEVVKTITTQLGEAASGLRISPIDDIGVLIVTGPPRTIAKLELLIEQIRQGFHDLKLRSIPLVNVSADWAIQRILQLNGVLSRSSVGNNPGGGGAQVPAAGQLSDLASRMWPDHGNTLLFKGDDREYQRIIDLLEFVDVVSPLDVKRYIAGKSVYDIATAGQSQGLGNIAAQQGANASGGTFSNRTQSGRLSQRAVGNQQQASSIAGSRFIIDETTGSFLYFGTPTQHDQVERLVQQFTAEELEFKVVVESYKLQYANAESLAEILNSVLEDPTQAQPNSPFLPNAGRNTGGLNTLRQQLDTVLQGGEPLDIGGADGSITATADDVNIVADVDRNQIVVRASARAQRDVERIIKMLDRRQPQVYIEVQLVKVTNTGTLDLAVQAEISPGRHLLFTNFGLGSASTSEGQRQVPNSLPGITSAMIQSDFVPFVIQALETESDTSIVSKPSLLVNDNVEAIFSSLRSEPFSSTSQTNTGTITSQGGVAEAGTTVNITPTISAGGSVKLAYSIELSDFDATADTGSGLQPPSNSNNYDSEVTVPGDSTIVVGGFSFQSDRKTESKVPILGDIPILGNLFKRTGNSKSTDTIFVFITPRIIYENDDNKLMLLSEGPMAKAGIDPDIPPLEPVRMPIVKMDLLRERLLPRSAPLPSPTAHSDSLSSITKD
jgi:type II secretory pathway component GspD/PulD (secretin)